MDEPHQRPQARLENLLDLEVGDETAVDLLISLIYHDLRRMADRTLWKSDTLTPTELVHELYVRVRLDLRRHPGDAAKYLTALYGNAARAMRQILVDRARRRHALRRGGGQEILPLNSALDTVVDHFETAEQVDLLDLDAALDDFKNHCASGGQSRTLEVVLLRFFCGFTVREIADHVRISKTTAEADLRYALAWLRARLRGE